MLREKIPFAIQRLRSALGLNEFNVRRRFGAVYAKNLFNGTESRSGIGSSFAQTENLRRELPRLLHELNVRKFLDAPCGDCHWIETLDWKHVAYLGADVVADLIKTNRKQFAGRSMSFLEADLCRTPLPPADMIFCRDCWVHLTFRQVKDCLQNFQRSGAVYLATTTFTQRFENVDLGHAIWRPLNLQRSPFRFPAPLRAIVEGCTEDGGKFADKTLGIWKLQSLNLTSIER